MIITICGMPGSGKTTVAKLLAKKLHYKHISTGDLRGELAREKGLTIDELNEIGRKEKWTDLEVDKKTKQLSKKDRLVIDSWLSWYFIPKSVKVFLDCDLKVASERIFRSQRPDESHQDTVEGVLKMIKKRLADTIKRFKKWYNIDWENRDNYDILIDTTNATAEQIADDILKVINKKKQSLDN